MFDEKFLTELTEKNDIVDVVSQYVTLGKKSGSNRFGLCPFHNEKTGSFAVNTVGQYYHCFGCHKGGGVINFIMDIEGLSFPEAVEFLAKRVGMTVPEQTQSKEGEKRNRLYALNKEAALYYVEMLKSPEGEIARKYIQTRRLSPAIVKTFGIGFAPNSWNALRDAMHAKGYSDFEMFDAGLLKKSDKGSFYDAFRNRLMFPIVDIKKNVLGFSGRTLGDDGAKYLNSPDTAIFKKGDNLFGLNIAKKSHDDFMLLVEGNVDVVMLHQAGFDSAVAALGTALTNEQARLISRFKDQVVLAYDNDTAGHKASQKAIEIFQKLDIKTKVLRIDGAKDPDEYIKTKGATAFRNLIEKSENQMDFRLQNILSKYDLTQTEGKIDYLKEATRVVASLPDKIAREVYARKVAEKCEVQPDSVINQVELVRRSLIKTAWKKEEHNVQNVSQNTQPHDRSLRYDNLESAVAEEGVIRLMYLDPSIHCDLKAEEFTSPVLGHLYEVLSKSENRSLPVLSAELQPEEVSLLVELQSKPEDLSVSGTAMKDYISKIRKSAETDMDLRELANKLKNEGKGYVGK